MSSNIAFNHKSVLSASFTIFLSIGSLLMLAWVLHGPEISHANAASVQNVGTWAVVSSGVPLTYSLNSVAAASSSDGWAVGSTGHDALAYSLGPLILRWNGNVWSQVLISSTVTGYYDLESVIMVSANDAWAVGGDDGSSESFGATLHWDGHTWNKMAAGLSYLKSLAAVSASDVWAVGGYAKQRSYPYQSYYGRGTIHWNGTSWGVEQIINDEFGSGLNSVAMVSTDDGWAVGWISGSNMILHWDGSAWTRVSSPVFQTVQMLTSVAMVSTDDGWAVGMGGTILHWDGISWSQAISPVSQRLNSITMLSANEGWVVGDSGTILHWDGNTWSQGSSPVTQTLKSVTMISANEGWAVGLEGTILHYTNFHRLYLPLVVR